MRKKHIIHSIAKASIAEEMGIASGDSLLEIDGHVPEDIFDYRFMIQNEYIELLIEKADGEQWLLEIDKEETEDLGLGFADGLMDEYRSCSNKCIFCFVDQMPKGMRGTLYFKDDDARLSFLQGNYVTLTNMSDQDVDRIIRYRLSPINISFHTTNPELRCRMLHNRFAGEALKKVDKLYQAGITMNGQIVLCKGINDGPELERSIRELTAYLPCLESVSVVPVGLTRYREGLYPLEPFLPADAEKVLKTIHGWQEQLFKERDTHFIHGGDEWYLLAGQELPTAESYDGYPQLANGVGMMRLLVDEFAEALDELAETLSASAKRPRLSDHKPPLPESESPLPESKTHLPENKPPLPANKPHLSPVTLSIATGELAYPYLKQMMEQLMQEIVGLHVYVYPITNHFFGERITVSGLLTGRDIISQLKGRELGERLLLPQNILRDAEAVFLDDCSLLQMEKALQVPIDIVKSSGRDVIEAVLKGSEIL